MDALKIENACYTKSIEGKNMFMKSFYKGNPA